MTILSPTLKFRKDKNNSPVPSFSGVGWGGGVILHSVLPLARRMAWPSTCVVQAGGRSWATHVEQRTTHVDDHRGCHCCPPSLLPPLGPPLGHPYARHPHPNTPQKRPNLLTLHVSKKYIPKIGNKRNSVVDSCQWRIMVIGSPRSHLNTSR